MTGIKRLAAFWLAFLLLTGTCLEVMAATKPINNVSIKVSSNWKRETAFPILMWEAIRLPRAGWR